MEIRKISQRRPRFVWHLRTWTFHVVVLQRTVKKCTKIYNARAQLLFCSLLRTHCCRHNCFLVCPRVQYLLQAQNCVRDTKNVSDFVQKHFVPATNVSQFAQHGNTTFSLCPARLNKSLEWPWSSYVNLNKFNLCNKILLQQSRLRCILSLGCRWSL